MLTEAQLTAMRTVAEDAMPGTAVVQSRSFSSDGGGGGSLAWTASGTVACRIAPIRGAEREIGDRISPDADSIVTLPFDTTLDTDARLVIDSRTYNVEAIRERSWPVTKRVEVVEET